MLIHIIISLLVFFVLMYLSVNILGVFVRSLFSGLKINPKDSDFIKKETKKLIKAERRANLVSFTIIIVYLYLLFHFWNFGVVIVALMIMLSRLPDLLWEIRNGKRMTFADANSLPKNILFFITAFSFVVEIPLLYYFLYYF